MKRGGFSGISVVESLIIMAFVLSALMFLSFRQESRFLENDCLINRFRIEEAKYEWALRNGKKIGDEVPEKEIIATLENRLDCPSGGKYSYGTVGAETICSIHKKRELSRVFTKKEALPPMIGKSYLKVLRRQT